MEESGTISGFCPLKALDPEGMPNGIFIPLNWFLRRRPGSCLHETTPTIALVRLTSGSITTAVDRLARKGVSAAQRS